jgi:hypothetical protein
MQRIKRIIALAAITATAAGSIPAIAAADTNTGSGSGSASTPTKDQVCAGLKAAVNILGGAEASMDKGSAAATVLHAAGDAAFNLGDNICAGA